MRALDQFSKFCAKITGGLADRPAQEPKSSDRGSNAPAPPRAKPAAPRSNLDDDGQRRHGVSHPAAWPR